MRSLIAICLFSLSAAALAQDFKDQFNQYKTNNERAYDAAMRRQDSIFARSIIDNWQALQLSAPVEKVEEAPKPAEQPVAEPDFELIEVQHKVIVPAQAKLMRSFNQPVLEIVEEYDDFELEERYQFYGEEVRLKYPRQFLKLNELTVSDENDLSRAWQFLSKIPHQYLVKSLYDKSTDLQLPDYGFLLLVNSFLERLDVSEQSREIYRWFLLSKAGYVSRIGLVNANPVLVIGSYGKIYGKRYYSASGVNYYVMSDEKGSFESYQVGAEEEGNLFGFSIDKDIKLPLKPELKEFTFGKKGADPIVLSVYHNTNVVNLLQQFPQTDLAYYLSSRSSDLLEKSLEKSLKPHLEGLSEMEKVTFLLEFVQGAFPYQADSRQFGKEKVMYPEEVFFHSYADCDDRVVLLAYLIRTFTELPMVAIGFPQHVALAVRLPAPTFGETINYKGYTFTFCDPTYFHAPLGSVIPQADRSKIQVIEF